MASTRDLLQQPVLNAVEIKELTGWPDIMVEDYLNLLSDLLTLANAGDTGAQSVLISGLYPINAVRDDEVSVPWTHPLENAALPQFQSPQSKTEYHTTAVNYTTAGNEFVEVTSNVTAFLNAEPAEGEQVIIKRNTVAGNVTIDANGSTIDGAATLLLTTDLQSSTLYFYGQWFTA
tara:strand:+ start:8017 stop:8544 length:528 start_codon:yes stop_codon:yes gene_type:complete